MIQPHSPIILTDDNWQHKMVLGQWQKLPSAIFFLRCWDFNAEIPQIWPKSGYSCLKSRYMVKFSKYQKNGRNFDQISATYHAFWQMLSKKCEIIENRKKLAKMPNFSKIVFFFILFSSQSQFFDLKWACGVVVSMFEFHRSERGSNPGRGGEFS